MQGLKLFSLILLITLLAAARCSRHSSTTPSEPGDASIKDSILTQGLSYPWEILWGPDNYIWMTERGGRISRVNPANGAVSPVYSISEVVSSGEGGLLGMVLHPNFSSSPYVYVAYNYDATAGYREKIVRFTYNGSTLTSPVTLIDNIAASGIHNGCRLLITPDLKLFITTGDASNQSLPQQTSSRNGKVLRLNLDGTVPSDNPVPGNPYWSFGHRNAQGLVYANNILYSSEHGPTTDDEINIIEKNRNYGWPDVHGYCDNSSENSFCSSRNVKEPLKTWTPTTAICGMDFYDHSLIPQWRNSLLAVALKDARLYQMKLNATHTSITNTYEYFNNKYGRLRDVCVAPNGRVYICTSNGGNDKIVVIDAR